MLLGDTSRLLREGASGSDEADGGDMPAQGRSSSERKLVCPNSENQHGGHQQFRPSMPNERNGDACPRGFQNAAATALFP